MQQNNQIATLVLHYLKDELTAEQQTELNTWLTKDPLNEELFNKLVVSGNLTRDLQQFKKLSSNSVRAKLEQRLTEEKINLKNTPAPITHRIHFLKTAWFRYAAAVVIALSIGIYFWNNSTNTTTVTHTPPIPAKTDVRPGSDKAILTLSTGQQISLSKSTTETIHDGNFSIQNNNGQLSYTTESSHFEKEGSSGSHRNNDSRGISYNTMTTPRGGQYQLTLADGTRVWLNAASSITFPTAFTGPIREVSITGEVYFEVVQNKEKPFTVTAGKEKIQVLGTSFNVKAYDDEPVLKTTLVEGTVKISSTILQPGQAYYNHKVVAANIEQDIAWKNGRFDFDRMKIEETFRQLARWYDIEVKYPSGVPDIEFYGTMGRNLSLNQVLQALKGADVHFELKNRVLTVTP